jgi:hypothetical protein
MQSNADMSTKIADVRTEDGLTVISTSAVQPAAIRDPSGSETVLLIFPCDRLFLSANAHDSIKVASQPLSTRAVTGTP